MTSSLSLSIDTGCHTHGHTSRDDVMRGEQGESPHNKSPKVTRSHTETYTGTPLTRVLDHNSQHSHMRKEWKSSWRTKQLRRRHSLSARTHKHKLTQWTRMKNLREHIAQAISTYVHTYVRVWLHAHTNMHTRACTRVDTYTCAETHISKDVHTYTHTMWQTNVPHELWLTRHAQGAQQQSHMFCSMPPLIPAQRKSQKAWAQKGMRRMEWKDVPLSSSRREAKQE